MSDTDKLLKRIKPRVTGWMADAGTSPGVGTSSSGAPSPHALSSIHHTGTLANAQAPQFLMTNGTRALTGNMSVSDGVTIDGVDLSVHVADPNAHHNQVHNIVGTDHTVTAAQYYLVGATATDTLGILASSNDVSAGTAAVLRSDPSGGVTLNNMLISGGDLTVGANIFFVDYSGTRVGINCAPDAQFDLDIAGNLRAQGWIVGKHAIQLDGAMMICHYDGMVRSLPRDFSGEPNGHMGQVGTEGGGVYYDRGPDEANCKFGKALVKSEAATNQALNPSFEVNSTDDWNISSSDASASKSRQYEGAYYGEYGVRFNPGTSTWSYIQTNTDIACADGDTVNFSVMSKVGTGYITIQIRNTTDATLAAEQDGSTSTGEWEKVHVSWTNSTGFSKNVRVRIIFTNASYPAYVDGVMFTVTTDTQELLYCDGTLPGHTWSGTAHNSTSSRTGASVSYVSSSCIKEEQGTVMAWVKPVSYGTTNAVVIYSSGATDYLLISFNSNKWRARVGTTATNGTTDVTWDDWSHVCLTWDGSNYNFYLNGSLEIGPISQGVTTGFIGTSLLVGLAAGNANFYIDDLVTLDRVITTDELTAVIESDAPVFAETSTFHFRASPAEAPIWADEEGLWMRDGNGYAILGISGVDSKSWGGFTLDTGDIVFGRYGASQGGWLKFDRDGYSSNPILTIGYVSSDVMTFDSGGATIVGKLRMPGTSSAIAIGSTPPTSASAGTGIWVDRTGIYGLSGGTKVSYMDASNGVFYSGGKALSSTGHIKIEQYNLSVISDVSANGSLLFQQVTGGPYTEMQQSTTTSSVFAMTVNAGVAATDSWFDLYVKRSGSTSVLLRMSCFSSYGHVSISGAGLHVGATISGNVSEGVIRAESHLKITDGITAPGTSASWASIYVDTADGDLKVKFGDGTVKTIVTDT